MSTYPARRHEVAQAIESVMHQVDLLHICFNEYETIPKFIKNPKINAFIPKKNYRDVGKFVMNDFQDDDTIVYLDDDIVYPNNYVELMSSYLHKDPTNSVVGLHGVIYSDFFCGHPSARKVFTFNKRLDEERQVNQLGTGTVVCKGVNAPPLEFMDGSQKFVDVRFARYQHERNIELLCCSRPQDWLLEIDNDHSIFESFTKNWPIEVTREVMQFGGYANLKKW